MQDNDSCPADAGASPRIKSEGILERDGSGFRVPSVGFKVLEFRVECSKIWRPEGMGLHKFGGPVGRGV